jgi:hypothetical protein
MELDSRKTEAKADRKRQDLDAEVRFLFFPVADV